MPSESPLIRRMKNFYHKLRAIWWAWRTGFPGHKLTVIGVTGTDGKTSTTHMTYHLLKRSGVKVALINTVHAILDDEVRETGLHVTSPDPAFLQPLLKEIVERGFEAVVLEVTSHALDQHRVWGVGVDIAAVTNIKEDHLDYHGSYDNYLKAKAKLFDFLKARNTASDVPKTAVLNAMDNAYEVLKQKPCTLRIAYNNPFYSKEEGSANLYVDHVSTTRDGSLFSVFYNGQELPTFLPYLGHYNLDNAQAALACGIAYGLNPKELTRQLRSLPQIPGRMQAVNQGQPFLAIVDFAHTPAALSAALETLSELPHNKLIVLFGCAAQRDPGRRKMGAVAARHADVIIITNEDNRHEPVEAIMQEIAAHAESAGAVAGDLNQLPKGKPAQPIYLKVADRREAIRLAVSLAEPQDIIDFTGKGHEQSLNVNGEELPWDEVSEVVSALQQNGYQN